MLIIIRHRNNQSFIYNFNNHFDVCSHKQAQVFKSVCKTHEARSHVLHTNGLQNPSRLLKASPFLIHVIWFKVD